MRRARCCWRFRVTISTHLFRCSRAILTIAYSHHSVLRDERREDALRELFSKQDERLGSLERAVASGNLALLERTQAPEHPQLVHVAKPIDPRRGALAWDDNKRHLKLDERQKRTWLCKLRLSLPLWLVNRVWEFGLREAEGGWTAQLYPIMVRPRSACVLDFVYSGDVHTVRRLLRSGQLSVRDHLDFQGTLSSFLTVSVWCSSLQLLSTNSSRLAASCGRIEFCRFLLQESGFFHDDEILLEAFTEHVKYAQWGSQHKELSKRRQCVEDFYRLFVSENNMNVDFRDGEPNEFSPSRWGGGQDLLLTVSSVRDILNGQSFDFDRLPFQQRFSTAVRSTGWPAEIFLSIFRHDDPASLAAAATEYGTTALHWAAAHLGAWTMRALQDRSNEDCSDAVDSYQRLVLELVRMGAEPHAIRQVTADIHSPMYPSLVREDPFVSFLSGLNVRGRAFDQKNLARAVHLWGQTITESGYSLQDYADAENLYLANLRHVSRCANLLAYIPVSVAVNEDSILQIRLVSVTYIVIWRAYPTEIPGAWPVWSDLPGIITWEPTEEDIMDGFQWVRTQRLELESAPRFADLTEEADVAYLVRNELHEARAKWFNGVQDDHGPIAMMMARASTSNSHAYRQHVRRRSASAPPPGSFEHAVDLERDRQPSRPGSRSWAPSVQKCPFDGRWGACSTSHWRWCMRGDLHNTPEAGTNTTFPYIWDWHFTWECSFLLDEDHTGLAVRFAERFRPEQVHMVEDVIRRAEERKALNLEEEVHERR
jgi:hypothetical protein